MRKIANTMAINPMDLVATNSVRIPSGIALSSASDPHRSTRAHGPFSIACGTSGTTVSLSMGVAISHLSSA